MNRSSRFAILLTVQLIASTCCSPFDGRPPCCTVPETAIFAETSASGEQSRLVSALLDAGVPMDVVLHGEQCLPLCAWAARECSYGPYTCAESAQRNDGGADGSCRQNDDGAVRRVGPELIAVRCAPGYCGVSGRRSYSSSPERHSDTLPDYLSSLAALEHESITAFTEMASFLSLHDAPAELISRLEVAAADEARHTHAMLTLARHAANTHVVLRDTLASHPPSLLDFALHNAREGCVRETYGASLAHYQAQHAIDPLVRDTFATIAIEESQHAQLSWDVAQWVDTLLTESERALVAHAITEATEDLAQSLAQPSPREWRDTLGLPSADVALAMHHQLRRALWTAHAAS